MSLSTRTVCASFDLVRELRFKRTFSAQSFFDDTTSLMRAAKQTVSAKPEAPPALPEVYCRRLGLGDPEFEGQIARRDIDKHKSVSKMICARDVSRLNELMGPVDARHIVPVKWFTHSFNRAWSRVIEQPWALRPLQRALEKAALSARAQSSSGVTPMELDPPMEDVAGQARAALLDLSRRAINQGVNVFIGSRDLNQLNGRLIGRMRRLLIAHDNIVVTYRDWYSGLGRFSALSRPNAPARLVGDYQHSVEQLARTVEKILFNPQASPKSALTYGKAKINQMAMTEVEHLQPVLEAMLDAIYNLGKAIESPSEAIRKILDLAVGIVDSVCVDASQVGQLEGAGHDENFRLFRAAQNELLLPRGAHLITSSTRFCNAVDAEDKPGAEQAATDYIAALSRLGEVSSLMRELWDIPQDAEGYGAVLAGLKSPEPRASAEQIEACRAAWRSEGFSARETILPPLAEKSLIFRRDSATGLSYRRTTPEWIRDIRQYLNRAAHGHSMFEPWLEGGSVKRKR